MKNKLHHLEEWRRYRSLGIDFQIEKYRKGELKIFELEKRIGEYITRNINETVQKINRKTITKEEGERILKEKWGAEIKHWHRATEKNPMHSDANSSNTGFKYDPTHHEQGRFFQKVIKGLVRFGIDTVYDSYCNHGFVSRLLSRTAPLGVAFAHSVIPKVYTDDAYRFDDPRLLEIQIFARNYFFEYFFDYYPEKYLMMCKLLDITLFLCKEDIFYRTRLFDFYNKFALEYSGFEMLPDEQFNLDRWTRKNIIALDKPKGIRYMPSLMPMAMPDRRKKSRQG